MTVLSDPDRNLWRGFRRSYEQASHGVERELAAAAGLSGADHGILSRLAEGGPPGMRQQDLADTMRWDRTRLSHHLTRMEQRALVSRSKGGKGGTYVALTPHGDATRRTADPIHDAAVMKHFIRHLSAEQRHALALLPACLSAER